MMSLKSKVTLIIFLILITTSCTTAEERLAAEYDTLSHPNSILLYEHHFIRSSATGECSVASTNWWYGSKESVALQDLIGVYKSQLPDNGWVREDDNTWYKESNGNDLYLSLEVFSDASSINRDQLYYFLPESMLEEAANYQTIYLIDMSYRSEAVRKRCFQ